MFGRYLYRPRHIRWKLECMVRYLESLYKYRACMDDEHYAYYEALRAAAEDEVRELEEWLEFEEELRRAGLLLPCQDA